MSAGGAVEPVVALKQPIDSGQIKGPRIIPSGPLPLGQNPTPQAARDTIRKLASADIHFTGEVNVNSDSTTASCTDTALTPVICQRGDSIRSCGC